VALGLLGLAGETGELTGLVIGWVRDGMAREGGSLAVLPTRPRGGSQLLRIAIAPPVPGALGPVGRTGRVLLDRQAPRRPELSLPSVSLSSLKMQGFPP
jgi:hypothetical protein